MIRYDQVCNPLSSKPDLSVLESTGLDSNHQGVENDYTKHPEVLALTIEPGVPEAKLSAFACHLARQRKVWQDMLNYIRRKIRKFRSQTSDNMDR